MNKTFLLYAVQTTPQVGEYTDVVTLVRWGIEFEKNGEKNKALIETLLPAPSPNYNFIPASQLTKDKIIALAIEAQGGESWIQQLSEIHEYQLDVSIAKKSTSPYTGSLQLDQEQFDNIPVQPDV